MSKNKKSKTKTAAIVASIGLLMTASGLTGYKLVKVGNYGGIEDNLHQVVRIVDGDTFEIKGEDQEKITIRILNMTTPDRGECFYKETKQALSDLILNKKVRLEKDVSGVDSYERLLRHVYLPSGTEKDDNIIVAKKMIETGMAQSYPVFPDVKYKTYLARFATEAQEDQLGVWGACVDDLPKKFAETANAQPENEDCLIKGNISQITDERIYFFPECPSYSQIRIDPSTGERYFCTEKEAQKAGFRIADSCDNIFKKNK
jgi:micrococcal nuclease